jgi:hypothetical protein
MTTDKAPDDSNVEEEFASSMSRVSCARRGRWGVTSTMGSPLRKNFEKTEVSKGRRGGLMGN